MRDVLKSINDQELIQNTKKLIQIERATTTEILHHLLEIENRRLFAKLGYSSLFDFATRGLGYTEAAAQRRISSMRLLREIPQIEEKLNDGSLSLSNVAKAQTIFQSEKKNNKPMDQAKKTEVLKKLENKSAKDAEKLLLEIAPQSIPKERERQITSEVTEIKIVADEALMQKLRKLKGLLSHRKPNLGNKELLEVLADMALKKLDPSNRTKPAKITSDIGSKRYIPVDLRRRVFLKHQSKCAYISPAGIKCESNRFLEVHHIRPFAMGGKTIEENLTLYCRTHNSWQAIQDYGEKKMGLYIVSQPRRFRV